MGFKRAGPVLPNQTFFFFVFFSFFSLFYSFSPLVYIFVLYCNAGSAMGYKRELYCIIKTFQDHNISCQPSNFCRCDTLYLYYIITLKRELMQNYLNLKRNSEKCVLLKVLLFVNQF